jgi:urease accessory protein
MKIPPSVVVLCPPAFLASLAPTPAQAHLVVSGMGPLYDGISHFALSPEDFLPVIALALFAGLRGPAHARALSWMIPLAWLAGGVLAMMTLTPSEIALSATTAVLFLLVGGLLAANLRLSIATCAGLGALLGVVRGMADLVSVRESPVHILMILGMGATTFATFAIAASVTLPLKRLWMVVVARTIGSWLAALGLLFAGWILRYGAVAR